MKKSPTILKELSRAMFALAAVLLILLIVLLMQNPHKKTFRMIYLDNNWFYSIVGDEETEAAPKLLLKHKHLERLFPDKMGYIDLYNQFYVPESLRNKNLGIFSSGMFLACEFFVNEVSVGKEGFFPDENKQYDFGPGSSAHAYILPPQILNQDGKNDIRVRLWVNGNGKVSNQTYISAYEPIYYEVEKHNFFFSKINIGFCVTCLVLSIFYFFIYIHRKKGIENLYFAIQCFCSSLFLVPFFINELIWIDTNTMLYLTFNKIFFSIPAFMAIYYATDFMIVFMGLPYPKSFKIIRVVLLLTTISMELLIPTYVIFCDTLILMFTIQVLQMLYPIIGMIQAMRKKQTGAYVLLGGFLPVIISIVFDFIIHIVLNYAAYPYFTVYGWQITLLAFLYVLSYRYDVIYQRYEYLANELENEVETKTAELTQLNENLVYEQKMQKRDMDMAVQVQQSFLPKDKVFSGWEVAVMYKPVAGVSGDFYDYYYDDDKLLGFSLFDVSGHGISAGLVTMLAKVQVAEQFEAGYKKNLKVDEIMDEINASIVAAKGDVENYLTGVLFSFNSEKSADFVCAGHPSPIKFDAKKRKADFINKEVSHTFCMVGIDGFIPTFTPQTISVNKDDLFVFYTDGVIETADKNGIQFGKEHLLEVIQNNHSMEPKALVSRLYDTVVDYADGRPLDDDFTVVIFKRKI